MALKPIEEGEIHARAAFVARDCEGVQPIYEVFYIQSILYTADRAHNAFRRFDAAISEGAADATIFALVQEALAHAGALSRFFWPMKKNEMSLRKLGGANCARHLALPTLPPFKIADYGMPSSTSTKI